MSTITTVDRLTGATITTTVADNFTGASPGNEPVNLDGVSDGTLTPTWDGSAKACAGFGQVMLHFTGISGGDSWVIKGSLAGTNYLPLSGVNLNGDASVTSITADGIYSFPAVGFVNFAKTGTASTPVISLLLKR